MADDRIDSIEVQIQANVSKAISQINGLISTLDKVRNSMNSVKYDNLTPDKSKLSEARKALNDISEEIDKINKKKVTITTPKTEAHIAADVLKQGIEDATQAIKRFTEIKRLAERGDIKISADGLESVQLNIEAAQAALERFLSIQAKGPGDNPFYYVVTEAEGAKNILENLRDAADMARGQIGIPMEPVIHFETIKEAQREIDRLEKRIAELRYQMAAYMTVAGHSVDDKAYQTMSNTLAGLEAKLRASQDALAGMSKAEGDTANEGNRLASVFNGLRSSVNTASSGFSKLKSAIKDIAGHVKSLVSAFQKLKTHIGGSKKDTDDFSKKLKHGLRNIMRYGFGIRSLYFLFRRLRRAIKEGFENLGQYSSEMQTTLNGLSASLTYVKNAFAAGFAPIVNVVGPYIEAFITMIGNALNAIGRFLAALTGKGFAVQAVKWSKGLDGVGDSAGGAAGSVKDLNKQLSLLPFDELNQLAKDNKSGSGGGGGSGASGSADIENMFTTIELNGDEWLQNWASDMREAFKNQDWEGLGQVIASGFNSAFAKASSLLSSEELIGAVESITTSVGTTFNSFVSNLNWEDLGVAIGNGINLVTGGIYNILTTIDWVSLGQGLAQGINGLVDTVDWETLGKTWAAKTNVIWQALEGLTSEVEWGKIGEAIAGFVNGFFSEKDFEAIATTISNAINGAFTLIGSAAENINWGQIADKISTGLNKFITSVDWAGNGGKLSQFATQLFDTIYQIAKTVDWEGLARGIGEFLDNIDWGTLLKDLLGTIWEIGTGIIKGLWSTTSGKIVLAILALKSPLGGAIKGLLSGIFGSALGGGGGALGGMSFASRLGNFFAVVFKTGISYAASHAGVVSGVAGLAAVVASGVKKAMTADETSPDKYTIFDESWSAEQIRRAMETGEYINEQAIQWAEQYDDHTGGLMESMRLLAEQEAKQFLLVANAGGDTSNVIENLKDKVSHLFGTMRKATPLNKFEKSMQGITTETGNFANAVKNSLNVNIEKQSKLLTDADKQFGKYDDKVKSIKETAQNTARTLGTDLFNAFTGVKGVASDAGDVISSTFSTSSGSQKMRDFMNGLKTGIENNKADYIKAMTDTGTGAVTGLKDGLEDKNAVKAMTDAASNLKKDITDAIDGNKKDGLKTAGENKGKEFTSGVNDGLRDQTFINPIKLAAQDIRDKAIVNPFNAKTTGITMGTDTGTGIKEGMTAQSTKQTLQSAAREQREALTTANQLKTWSTIGETLGKEIAKGITRVKMPKIEYDYSVVKSWNGASGNKLTIPGNFVVAQAKGGLVTSATLSLIGEAGREAVLPLTNKRAMGMIADSILGSAHTVDTDDLARAVVMGVSQALMAQNERPIEIQNYVTVKTENDEVLARAVDRGNRSLQYRGRLVTASR